MAGDLFASPFGTVYSAYMQRPWLSRPIGAVVWGGDIRPFYESMAAIGEVPEGGTIVDCPCGAGVALGAIEHSPLGRYIAVDLSTAMLRRARRRASALGLSDIEWLEADAARLPLASASGDLFLSYWGLHCFDDPESAVLEAARVLKPGGQLVGASFVRGPRLRQRLLVRPGRGAWGDVGTKADLRGWLADAQLADVRLRTSGPMAYFEARKASAAPPGHSSSPTRAIGEARV